MLTRSEPSQNATDRTYAVSLSDMQASVARGALVAPTLQAHPYNHPAAAPCLNGVSTPWGSQELITLSDDLMLVRSDIQSTQLCGERDASFDIDIRGWLYLHFRLDGISIDRFPDGATRTVAGGSFLVGASSRPTAFTRQVMSDAWQAVTIAFRPSDTFQSLPVTDYMLPSELRRFRAGDPDVEFLYASPFTADMRSAAGALLRPLVSGGMRPVYLRAKGVELVCLAVEQVGRPAPQVEAPLRLSHRDVRALEEAKHLVDRGHADCSLEQLARRVGINRRKLSLGFKILFGETVGDYRRDVRLDVARRMLEDRTASVTYAATVAGYSDVGSFGKAFKAKFGWLPSQSRPVSSRRPRARKSNASPISE